MQSASWNRSVELRRFATNPEESSAGFDPSEFDQFECPDSDEEIQRRRESGGGRPLADIVSDLESQS